MPAYLARWLPILILIVSLTACNAAIVPTASPTAAPPSATPTATATPVPLAALVNGSPIPLVDLQSALTRAQAAGTALATTATEADVLAALVDAELLAQAALAAGYDVSAAEVEAQIEAIAQSAGGSEAMGAWMAANGFDLDSLRRSLRRELLADWQANAIADELPAQVEHVQLRHILVATEAEAIELQAELAAGADFGQLAATHSLDLSTRLGGGAFGWVPQGVLSQPQVETAAFEMAPGDSSPIVESELGYHLLDVTDREQRELSSSDRRRLRISTVHAWLEQARTEAEIEILVSDG